MLIRSAFPTDSEKIAVTHRASIKTLCAPHHTPEAIAGWTGLLTPDIYGHAIREKIMVVAEENEGIFGLGILNPASGEIGAVYVHPRAVGTGVGKALITELETRAMGTGVHELRLCATINAVDFYGHCGYLRLGESAHELPNGVRLPCIRMAKALDDQNG